MTATGGEEPDFTVEVALPPEEALARLAEPARWSEWVQHFASCEPATDGTGGWIVTGGQPKVSFRLVVRAHEPGRSAEIDRTPLDEGRSQRTATLSARVEPTESGSRLLVRFRPAEGRRSIFGRIDAAFTRWDLKADLERWARTLDPFRPDPADPDAAVIEAVRRELLPPRPKAFNWRLLLGSIVVFVAIGWLLPSWREAILWLVPILLIHEFSHFLVMRRFGFRNLQMMFIPFFGAVVSGHRFNVPGWKQCVVSLAGPLPSIAAAAVAGPAAAAAGWTGTADVMRMALLVNAFNLLPIFPLDGGQVVRATIFCRAPLADAGFRAIAAVALAGVGWWGGAWVMFALGILLLLGTPHSFRKAAMVRRLRRSGFRPLSPDGDTIEEADVRRILAAIRAAPSPPSEPSALATRVIETYLLLNLRPPGVLASLGFLALQVGGFVGGLWAVILIRDGLRAAAAT